MTAASSSPTERIARLNDCVRLGFDRGERIVVTTNLFAKLADNRLEALLVQAALMRAVSRYPFGPDDALERERGPFSFREQPVYFRVDAYDCELAWGSEDPSDPTVTRRVLTIMHREDL